MSFVVACPSCGLQLTVPESAIGQQGKCSSCGTVFTIEQPYAPPGSFAAPQWAAPPPGYEVTPGVIRFGDGMSRAFTVLHNNVGTFVLICFVWALLMFGMFVLQYIPLLGIVLALANTFVIGPALNAGMYRACLVEHDGSRAEVGHLFSQFELWVDFLLLVLVQAAIGIAVLLIPAIVLGVGLIPMLIQANNNPNFQPEGWQIGLIIFGVLLFIPLSVFMGMVFAWALPALIDRRRGFWDAITTSWNLMKANPLGTFGTIIVSGLVASSGILLCCVGWLYTVPAAFCIVVATYRTAMAAPTPAPPPAASPFGPPAFPPPPPLNPS